MVTSVTDGSWVDPELSDATVGEMASVWLASKQALKQTTRVNYEVLWRVHVEPCWGSTPLRRVTVSGVTAWVARLLAEGTSPSWTRQALIVLRQILDLAVEDSRLVKNVAARVKGPRLPRREPRFLAHGQLLDLATACGAAGPGHETFVLLAGLTGLRWGELRALRVRHIDMLRCRIQVSDNLPARHRPDQVVTPKSHQARTVTFPKHLRERMAISLEGKRSGDFVFGSDSGQPLDLSNWRRRVFDPAVRETGLDRFTPHDLRHTAASLAVSAGADVKVVQRMLGHASAAMTLDTYAGLFADDLDQVAALMSDQAVAAEEQRRGTGEHNKCPTATPIRQRFADELRTARLCSTSGESSI